MSRAKENIAQILWLGAIWLGVTLIAALLGAGAGYLVDLAGTTDPASWAVGGVSTALAFGVPTFAVAVYLAVRGL